ncbi:hypothetical protein HMF7854_05885 [Sphingomonas ginkgonis]|uniref:Histidine phosphatase family protein n=1 Tax=Sphingomonas ginkgonis TaxID=2315330 RepID=A0A429V8Y7_9SPHN|nr:hypothetical protein [Sphingomonas ginkgonis]RST30406.1 hypothetical protein HMF7854_05885 [Sphingomonas ginkgonis]
MHAGRFLILRHGETVYGAATHLVVMHGISSRVLRGLLTGRTPIEHYGAPIAPKLAQGSVSLKENGVERIVLNAAGGLHA